MGMDNREKILDALKKSSMGLTTTEIQKTVNVSYPTLIKWLEVLRVEGLIDYRAIGKSRLWFASEKIRGLEKPLLDKLLIERIISGSFGELKEHLTSDDVGVISLMDTRYALAEGVMVTRLVELYFNLLPYEKAVKALYDLGRGLGRDYVKFWEPYCTGMDKELLRIHLSFFSMLGWGRGEISSYRPENGRCTIRVYNHPIRLPKIKKPVHFLDAGIFAEILNHIAGKKVEVVERKCIGVGDKYCLFESKPGKERITAKVRGMEKLKGLLEKERKNQAVRKKR